MSLLLDALQRASKEKEKATATAAPADKPATQAPLDMALEPVLPPSPAEPSSPPPAPPAPIAPAAAEIPASPDTPLEFSFTPTPTPAPVVEHAKPPTPEKIEPTLTSMAPPPAPTPVPEPAPAPPANPISEPPTAAAPAVTTPTRPASPERPAPQLSPQVAREILYASAGNHKPKANKRLIAMIGIAVVLALSLGGLFLFQTQNPPSGIATPQVAQTPPAANPPSPITTASTPDTTLPPGNNETPANSSATNPAPPPAPATAPPESKIAEASAKSAATAAKTESAAPKREEAAPVSSKPVFIAKPGGSATLDAAYKALTEGRLEAAESAYRQALRNNPDERDALLGLAHIAHRQGQRDEARAFYQRVLRQDPDHPVANAGLLALSDGDAENMVSRARDMADKNPESAAAQSTLGSTLAREGQLADAQQAFFKAMTLEPDNPLHAYNLAVALDRMHKHDLARTYYERALQLADKSGAGMRKNFPHQAALDRLEQLRSRGSEGVR